MTTVTTAVTLPPGPAAPRAVQGAYALTQPLRGMRRLKDRYGDAFTVNVPIFGHAVVISDPAEIKQLFTSGPDLVDNLEVNLGRVLGPHSMFALSGDEHKKQRKLLVPPFHGRRLAAYEQIVEELKNGDGKLLDATILEVQRTRPVIDLTARQVKQDGYRLGRWTLPKGYAVLVSIALIHDDDAVFPHRFEGARPDLYQWIPFGGGTRRCLGAAFATMEMTVVLRTLLRDFDLVPTAEHGEHWHSRGVAYAPAKGGRAIVRRRSTGGDS